jgi:UDP-glucose 4-epimerase
MKKDNVFISGGAGFLGSHLIDEVLSLGMRPIVLDDLSGGFEYNVNPDADFYKGSINDTKLVNGLFKAYDFKYVYHLAAYAAEGLSHFIKRFNYENNLIGSINLINAAVNHKVKCFVFTSSMAVYGSNQVPMREDMIPAPEDSYGIAKYAVEQELKITREMFGLDYIIFRPHNIIGPRQNIGDRYRNVVGIFMNEIMQGKPLTIFGDGEQTRAFSYVADVAPTIARAPLNKKAYGQIFNIGADTPYTINRLATEVAKAMGVDNPKIVHNPPRVEVKHAYTSHKKVQEVFGYASTYSLQAGLKEMAVWAKKVGAKKSKKFKNIEIAEKLPEVWKQ